MPFRDYFSKQSKQYSEHRPRYPGELFDKLAGLAPGCQLAWDCGTGNGQAALELAERFELVAATDASYSQLKNAFQDGRISYRVEQVEASSLPTGTVDLITVGTAIHWFDFEAFYRQVRRVCKPGGILAAWTYHFPVIEPQVDHWLDRFYYQTLAGFWPERIRYLEAQYRTIPFPFEEIEPPEIWMEADWNLENMTGFIDSWSGTRRYLEREGEHSLDREFAELQEAWGQAEQKRKVKWPLHIRIGRVGAGS